MFTDGHETFSLPFVERPKAVSPRTPSMAIRVNTSTTCTAQSKDYTIVNIGRLYADRNVMYEDAAIVVEDGRVKCLGTQNDCEKSGDVYDLRGGTVIPVQLV